MSNRTLGPGSLSIGDPGSPRQFAGDVTKISLTPKTDSEDDTPLLDGSSETGADTTTWELSGSLLDQYTQDSAAVWAAENAGKEEPFAFTPSSDADADLTISGTIKVQPIGLGGDVKKKNANDFTFPLVGDPTFA